MKLEQQNAFNKLKEALITTRILQPYDHNLSCMLDIDSSDFTIIVIL